MTPVARVSVVTGAAGAMGAACALALAPASEVLVVTDIDGPRLGTVADAVHRDTVAKVEAVVGDIGDDGFVRQLAARTGALGDLRALVHTAGLSPSMAGWQEIIRVDLAAVPLLLDSFLPNVVPGSVAVCLASIAGHLGPFDPAMDQVCDAVGEPGFEERFCSIAGEAPDSGSTYRLAKRAVIRCCERAAVEWGRVGGRVVSVSPGLIDTGMGRLELEHNEVKREMAALTPVGGTRTGPETVLPGLADDIAAAVMFLCSDRAAFISGCDLRVDGGLVAAIGHRSAKGSAMATRESR